jgi:ribonuclease HI
VNSLIETLLYNQEKLLLEQSVRKSPLQIESMLADSFIEIGCSGKVYNKAQIIKALQEEASAVIYKIENFRIIPLTEDIVLAAYTALRNAEREQTEGSLRSSIWQFNEGVWKMVFHQGTLIR